MYLSSDNSATSVSNLDPRDDDPIHNQSEMSFFLYRRPLLPMYLRRCTAAHWVDVDWFGEFRLTVASDKHGALPPSRSPRCKSHTVTSVCRTDYSWHYWTVIHHNFLLLNFCSKVLSGRSMLAHLTRWSCRIWSHELGFTLTWLVAFFFYMSLHLIWLGSSFCLSVMPHFLRVGSSMWSSPLLCSGTLTSPHRYRHNLPPLACHWLTMLGSVIEALTRRYPFSFPPFDMVQAVKKRLIWQTCLRVGVR